MNQHKASNGVTVYLDSNGNLKFQKSHAFDIYGELEAFWVQAAREFFQAERDEQLGRWRDTENADWVVYPDEMSPDWVLVLQESTGDTDTVFNQRRKPAEDGEFTLVADRYFEAHPEPKPWHGAEGREVWEITVNGEELLCRSNSDGDFTPVFGHHHWATIANGCHEITAGHRIWPEEDK